ncbi:hypothetical protein CISG_00223 [Coccidioides immitis RMSCC 3703]|uniref:Protein kinase domain-containing protein n=1 Tax=Coccidioides immitis RMSCC 3703 TaxID=454286 RepID=A0A0J8QHU1_COCIT|nr:hypothetical protein CISG_00223 [Coccidioides immitis RMSCC 3703]
MQQRNRPRTDLGPQETKAKALDFWFYGHRGCESCVDGISRPTSAFRTRLLGSHGFNEENSLRLSETNLSDDMLVDLFPPVAPDTSSSGHLCHPNTLFAFFGGEQLFSSLDTDTGLWNQDWRYLLQWNGNCTGYCTRATLQQVKHGELGAVFVPSKEKANEWKDRKECSILIEKHFPVMVLRIKRATPCRPVVTFHHHFPQQTMEESRILGEDLPLTTDQLFERLGQIPGYTWDTTLQPVHSSYDHWQVTGTKHSSEPDVFSSTPASSSSFSKDSSFAHDSLRSEPRSFPRNNGRSSISEFSSGVASLGLTPKECKHTVRPIDIIRFTPQPGHRAPLLVTIFEFPGPNYLGELVSFGPAFYQAKGQCDPDNLPLVDEVPLSVFLDFAIGACECLELLHYGLKNVHGEIRADAFHFSRETGAVKLSNTGNGSRAFDNALSEGWSTLSKESGAKDKLRSIAPEQTGRLLTEPDSRTDIYALGVLFWSMLVGRPAFDGNDPVEVVQNVLSKRLSPVSSKRMDTPDAISAVIQKMVQKQITDRYHTISSVKMDLQKIMKLLGDGDSQALKTFQIAQRDVTAFFTLPTALFGRKEECERILQVVQRRLQEPSVQPNTKTSVHPKYSFSSGSSVSGERIDPIEFGDASSDSGSYGLASFRNTPTPVPNLLPQLSSHASTNSVESSASTQKNLHLSRVKSPIDSRLSWDNSDKEAGAGGLSTPQENFPWLGKLMAQSKYRHGGRWSLSNRS